MKDNSGEQNIQSAATAPLAIVGIGSIFPQAGDQGTFWTNIKNGADAITEVPATHWRSDDYFDPNPKAPDKVYARCGGFLSPVDFNPLEYGVLPNALEAIDTSQLLGLVAVDQALQDAGYTRDKDFDRERVSVILGVTGTLELVVPLGARLGHPRWREALKDAGIADAIAADVMQRISDSYVPWQENSFPGLLGNVVAGRISKHFDFGGTNCVVDAACGSSLGALNLAALELAAGKTDMVITGGIDTFNDIFMYTCFSKTPALSPSGHARPFAAEADGTTLGEGLGIVVIKRLADAERDGDKIYALIKGIGSSSDGRGVAIYEPSAEGQQKALRRAYEQSGVDPRTIELIEAHGTGTKVGDAVEVSALKEVFGTADFPWCAIGSIKSQIGHTKAAAGSAGLIKAALALYHKTLPPTIKVTRPQDIISAAHSPFYINTAARPWIPLGDYPRRAGVSALGFGGSNFHCLLEEHHALKTAADWQGDVQLVAFSGPDEATLEKALEAFPASGAWSDLRLAAAHSRRQFDSRQTCRLILVLEQDQAQPAAQIQGALTMLRTNCGHDAWHTPDGSFFARSEIGDQLAILFPGQGAQYPGMLKDMALQFPEFLDTFTAAERAFTTSSDGKHGRLTELVYPRTSFDQAGAERNHAKLQATQVAQPALGAVSLAARNVLTTFGVVPDAYAGHSYGELTALCCGGYFDSATLHDLSHLRGALMASGEGDRGSMLAVSAPLAQLEQFLADSGLSLVVANRNTPEQGVLSGTTKDIEQAAALLDAQGISYKRLAVAAAFHSELVAAAAEPFGTRLNAITFSRPATPVYANTTGAPYAQNPDEVRQLLARQLACPVDFVAEIEAMYAAGTRIFLEVGPGARLTAMVRAILAERPHQAFALDASNGKRSGICDLGRALAQLAILGHPVDLNRWDEGYATLRQSRPEQKRGITVPLTGANYFKAPPKRPALPQSATNTGAPAPASGADTAPRVKATIAAPDQSATIADNASLHTALQLTQQSFQALQTLQEQTARLHQQFLSGQESAARSFLQLVEQQSQLLHGQQPPLSSTAPSVPTTPPHQAPPAATLAAAATADTTAVSSVAQHPPVALDCTEIAATLLAVIAEKTGYPEEMLDLEMTLDTDLGIDSIKRVEILSALQEKLPDAPSVKPEDLGVLQTLGQIVAHLGAGTVDTAATPQTIPQVLDSNRVATVLLSVIAEKTGYPLEMLELEMALDTDLGIDSIKRVEILSALQEQLPDAPAVKPENLGVLQTLGQIVAHLSEASGRSSAPQPVASATGPLNREVVAAALLNVIAEKTGYPLEMLELEMALDTDLGIDSIKRVEILSALQDQLPGAPAIKPEHLGTLQTVAQIVDFLASVSGAAEPAPKPEAPFELPSVESGIERKILKAVPLRATGNREAIKLPQKSVVWVSDDGSALTTAICQQLSARQLNAQKISIDQLSSLPPAEQLSGLIILTPQSGASAAFLQQAFQLLQLAEPGLKLCADQGGAILATVSRLNGHFALPGGGPISDPVSGGLAGLAKTAGHEWPTVSCRAFDLATDLEDVEQTAHALLAELLVEGPQEVGFTPDGRITLSLTEESLAGETHDSPVSYGDVVVISGGARGVTAEVAVALAAASHATLLLLGRSAAAHDEPVWLDGLNSEGDIKKALIANSHGPLKPKEVGQQYQQVLDQREIRNTLRRIKEAGGQPIYRCVDLRDAAAVALVINAIREEYGPIKGLIHGAGVLADRLIKDKTSEQFSQVVATKVAGLENLLAALTGDELRFMVMFSSSTGRFGRTGQVDYAVANEVLNKMAQQQAARHTDCRVLSLNWGPWDGGMVTPALKKIFAEEGIAVIDLQAGAHYLVEEISTPPGGPVELVILGGRQAASDTNKVSTHENIYVSKAFDLEISIANFPFLASHVIDGKAVLPMAMIIEWMAHGAIHNNPGLRFHGFNDLRILKGVTLEDGQSHTLQVTTGKAFKSGGVHVVPVELSGVTAAGQHFIHSRARMVLAAKLPEAKVAAERHEELAVYTRPVSEIYHMDRLFHGPAFHSIREVIGCSAEGIASLVRPAPLPSEWINQPLRNTWLADPLALDSSFQLMILWSFERYQAASLPVFAGRYRQYQDKFPTTGVEVRITVTHQSADKAGAQIDFVDPADSTLIARIEEYECVIDASLNASFQRNKLRGAA
ncbi:MAG: SDR family NAD(P)-dependent oxidoreductase [Desulfuromonadales bacterium]|nr:SDR family NAD(P)-dependent oxidoreductase [Desulfuromonadales bacterium]